MNFSGIQYLMIDIANSFGHDKKTWEFRLDWFDQNRNDLESLVSQAEEPAQFYAGVLAYRKAQQGLPTGYMCGLDATASGIQLLAIMSGCRVSAESVNLTGCPDRQDIYTAAYARMNEILRANGMIPRSDVKQALMTAMYGSKAEPKKLFGDNTPELSAFYQMIDELLPGVNELNKGLINLWQPDVMAHYWQLPDGFEVVIKVLVETDHVVEFNGVPHKIRLEKNLPKKASPSLAANITHSVDGMIVREMNRRCNFNVSHVNSLRHLETGGTSLVRSKDQELIKALDLSQASGFFSGGIIDHLDERNFGHLSQYQVRQLKMLLCSMYKSFPVISIHDCFKFHANNGNDVRDHYRNILAELAGSKILQFIAAQIVKQPLQLQVDDISDLIADSSYALS